MKLIDFYDFEPLNTIKASMGIPRNVYGDLKIEVQESRLSEIELEKLISPQGLEINIDQLTVLSDGTLAYKNSRVILYIRDVTSYSASDPKFHISNCTKLQSMRSEGKFNRYVISTRMDGQFFINRMYNNKPLSQLSDLRVCQFCLSKLSFDGYSYSMAHLQKKKFVDNFKIKDFFDRYPVSLLSITPSHNSDTSPINAYPKNWDEISRNFREQSGWQCGKCSALLRSPSLQKYLDVHHKNSLKYDCSNENLEVICIGCHAEEFGHGHMKHNYRYKEYINMKKDGLISLGKE